MNAPKKRERNPDELSIYPRENPMPQEPAE
jgi:hypothetical protein